MALQTQITCTVTGDTPEALALTLRLIADEVEQGYLTGFNSNEQGSYSYDVVSCEPED